MSEKVVNTESENTLNITEAEMTINLKQHWQASLE